jgi:hypothetical protein
MGVNMQTTTSRIAIFLVTASLGFAQTDIAGKWNEQTTGDKCVFQFNVNKSALTGSVALGGSTFSIEDGKVIDSETISFAWATRFPPEGREVRRSAVGKVSGDEIKLAIKVTTDMGQESLECKTLKRSK